MTYRLGNETLDSIKLICMVVSRGLKIDREVDNDYRIAKTIDDSIAFAAK